MALKFNQQSGGAKKSNVATYKIKTGQNSVRIVGDILARYVYWIPGGQGNVPVECLAFNRDEERFDNMEKDWVDEYYPDLKCSWSYATQIIDPDDGKVKVFNLKKKLWEQIMTAAEDLGDPTDPDNGWDIVFQKQKTGPHNFNVEYTLLALKCKNRALTDEEKALLKDLKSMDEVIPRPTPDQIKTTLDRIKTSGSAEEPANETDDEALEEEFKIG